MLQPRQDVIQRPVLNTPSSQRLLPSPTTERGGKERSRERDHRGQNKFSPQINPEEGCPSPKDLPSTKTRPPAVRSVLPPAKHKQKSLKKMLKAEVGGSIFGHGHTIKLQRDLGAVQSHFESSS